MRAVDTKTSILRERVLGVRNRRKNGVFVANAKWAMSKKNFRISVAIKRLDASKRKKLRI